MFELNKTVNISAAHRIPGHDTCGKTHGHSYKVTIKIICNQNGLKNHMVLDFKDIKRLVKKFDHKNLNELDFFEEDYPPTTENLAKEIHSEIAHFIYHTYGAGEKPKCIQVKIAEEEGAEIIYNPYAEVNI